MANPGQESASPEVVTALDTVGISDISDTRIDPMTKLGAVSVDFEILLVDNA